MSYLNNSNNEEKSLLKIKILEKISRQISIANSSENGLTTDITINKSDNSYKQNHIKLAKSNNVSIQRYKSTHQNCSKFKPRCANRVTFIDQLGHVPFASITLIESFKKYNSNNTYDSYAPSEDSQKSNCCRII